MKLAKKQSNEIIKFYRYEYEKLPFRLKLLRKLRFVLNGKPKYRHFILVTKSINGKKYKDNKFTNDLIFNCIKQNKPIMVSRFGSSEAGFLSNTLFYQLGLIKNIPESVINNIKWLSGFYQANNPQYRNMFCEQTIDALENVDLLGYWPLGHQEMLIDTFRGKDLNITKLQFLDPYLAKDCIPWSQALQNKKVVVVHPFSRTITEQYKRKDDIWSFFPENHILPDFQLRVVQAVQNIAGEKDERFSTWFEALDWMENECFKEDFDVAIIGCGAYGMLLASRIKNRGKTAIHLGGTTQVLFGIKGKRFDDNKMYSTFYNDCWVRPHKEETPQKSNTIEDGCYW